MSNFNQIYTIKKSTKSGYLNKKKYWQLPILAFTIVGV